MKHLQFACSMWEEATPLPHFWLTGLAFLIPWFAWRRSYGAKSPR